MGRWVNLYERSSLGTSGGFSSSLGEKWRWFGFEREECRWKNMEEFRVHLEFNH